MSHDSADLEELFRACFYESHTTVLEGGGEEPMYLPAVCAASSGAPASPHRIVYRADYFASALHEVAHWCLAGSRRLQLEDYGYWYAPDGRSPQQQAEFERVEARPQALESIFARACGSPFVLSADNLEGDPAPSVSFASRVECQRERLLHAGLPPRARLFQAALERHYPRGRP